jgi:hypothetical protein
VTLERCRRIAIKRRADLVRDARQADIFGMKYAELVMEVMHGKGF